MKKFSVLIISICFCFPLFAQALDSTVSASSQTTNTNSIDSIFNRAQLDQQLKDEKDKDKQPKKVLLDSNPSFANPQMAMSNIDYMVSAGDIYTLSYAAGTTPVTYIIPVDASYKIRVANLAVLEVEDKTYLQLKKQVEEIVTRNYPLSGVQFVLTTPATFSVTIKGEVEETTQAIAWPLSRLSSFVNQITTDYSSMRDIKITSVNGRERTYDLFRASRFGELKNDPYLRPGDVVTVNRVQRSVTLQGAVERPGIYQLLPGENIESLVNVYGSGLKVTADPSRIEITRIKTDKNVSGEKFYINEVKKDSDFELFADDSVFITTYSDLKPVMFMEGAVGEFASSTNLNASDRIPTQFEYGTNYAYFIRTNSKLFKSSISDNENAYIIRGSEIIPIDIDACLYDADFQTDLLVADRDVLVVPFKQYFVTVAGAVRNPGRYPYIPDRSYEYYVALAGGFTPMQNAFKSVKITDSYGKKLNKKAVITPECQIVASSNHIAYIVVTYGGLITSIGTLITSILQYKTLFGSR